MRMTENGTQLSITYTPAEAAAARVALLISFLSVTKRSAPDDRNETPTMSSNIGLSRCQPMPAPGAYFFRK